jgi:hypothetical protein
MNDFLYAHNKTFIDKSGQNLTIFFDVNFKKNILTSLRFEGTLAEVHQKAIDHLVDTFLNKTLDSIPEIVISNSVPLWLFYSALDEYQGHAPFLKEINDTVCLCFGITKQELKNANATMAGRACGSCAPHIKKKEFKKIAGLYPGPLVVKLDELKDEWAKEHAVEVSIENMSDNYLEVRMNPYDKEKLQSLSDYWYLKLKNRFFLRGRP